MNATNVNNFLLSLAAAIAAETGLELENAPRSMWVHDAIEGFSTSCYSVLRIYAASEPGSFAAMRIARVSVQHDTRGTDSPSSLAQAWRIHEALLDDEGRPRMHWHLAGKALADGGNDAGGSIIADADGGWDVHQLRFIGAPGVVGRDEQGRWIATGNVEMEFERAGQ